MIYGIQITPSVRNYKHLNKKSLVPKYKHLLKFLYTFNFFFPNIPLKVNQLLGASLLSYIHVK
jgi:hypothetical protein